MIAREKMLYAMIDCKPIEFTYSEMERLAKTETYEMIDDFVNVMYDLKSEIEALEDKIFKLNSRLAINH